jgi:nitrogen regulatory protein PII
MNVLLVLNITPELEEELVDYLLSLEEVGGFTSYPVHGHGEQGRLSIAEQVSGRRKRVQFEILLPEQQVDNLIAGLAEEVGKGIHYWQLPVMRSGHL